MEYEGIGFHDLSDDFICLIEFKENKKAIFKLVDAGISKTIPIFIMSTTFPTLHKIEPFHLHHIKSSFPTKTKLTINIDIASFFFPTEETNSSASDKHAKFLSTYDLWVKKSDANSILKRSSIDSLATHLHDTAQIQEKERASMLKLILGMAIDAYKYDPHEQRNPATGNNRGSIKASLDELGLTMDEDTIRKYLNEAKAMYSKIKIRPKNKILQN